MSENQDDRRQDETGHTPPSSSPSRPDSPSAPQAETGFPPPEYPPRPPMPAPSPQSQASPGSQPRPGAGPADSSAFGGSPTQPTQPTVPLASAPTSAGASQPGTPHRIGAGKVTGLLVAAALVGGAAGIGGSWAGSALWSPVDAAPAARPAAVTVNDSGNVNQTTAIAAKVVPSVVTVNVSAGSAGGTGSGVVLDKQGHILTNTHVVTLDGETGKASITVTTSDGHIYPATIVGTDPVYDLAVIKVEKADGLTPVNWGDSSDLNVGDQTVAVGAPLGLSNTVTTGIVSALNRSIEIASSAAPDGGQNDGDQGGDSPFFFDFGHGQQSQRQPSESIKIAVIQTDAPINPGNSGGALVDSAGRLVGINVAIASAGGSSSSGQSGSIGVGFSIPSDVAHRVADEIIKDGSATHGLLGASVRDAASVRGATITGAYVVETTRGGGAAKAGLRDGDVITAFNDVPVGGAVDLTAQVRAAAAGSDASVTYVRDGHTHTAQVTLGALK